MSKRENEEKIKQEKEQMIEQMRNIAKEKGVNSIARNEFFRITKIPERRILYLFDTYNGLVRAAGLEPTIFPKSDEPVYSDKELLLEVVRVIRLQNSKLTRIYFDQNREIGSSSLCERRFGGWLNTLKTSVDYLDAKADSSLITRIKEYTAPTIIPSQPQAYNSKVEDIHPDNQKPQQRNEQQISSSNIYGDFINFRGLQHAPVNEQGVVFLFGMICREMGYVVEIVRAGFPDCEAKRSIRSKPGMWERVRIEFEYMSKNFQSHGHDPDQCDVIVCWKDNWPECPIEIIELSREMEDLPQR